MTEHDDKIEEAFTHDVEQHDHIWDVLAVNDPTRVMPFAQMTTNVLLRCGICRLPKAFTVVGSWTIDQVKGAIDGTE